jgi:hypothetical protein
MTTAALLGTGPIGHSPIGIAQATFQKWTYSSEHLSGYQAKRSGAFSEMRPQKVRSLRSLCRCASYTKAT